MKGVIDSIAIRLYSLFGTYRWVLTIPAMMVIAWFSVMPIAWLFIISVYRALVWFGASPDGDYALLVMLAGVVALLWLYLVTWFMGWLMDSLRHLIYRPYVNAMMRKYHNHDI